LRIRKWNFVTCGSLFLLLTDFFPENLDEVSDEQVEHFHQDIKTTVSGMNQYWQILYRDAADKVHRRKKSFQIFNFCFQDNK